MYFNVNFNVLKQMYCVLVVVVKDWMSQNARHNCEKNETRFDQHPDFTRL